MAETDLSIPEDLTQARSWMKEIPAFGALFTVTFLVLEWLISVRPEVSGMSPTVRHYIAFFAALVLVGIGYSAGNFCDDRVFDPLYGFDPKRKFVGRYVATTRRNLLGFLPAGDDLDRARIRAIKALLPKGSDGSGVYRESKKALLASGKSLDGYLPLSKLFRSLIWPAVLLSAALLISTVYRSFQTGAFDVSSLIQAIVALLIGAVLFIPYIGFRVEHMTNLYQQAVDLKGAAQQIVGRERRQKMSQEPNKYADFLERIRREHEKFYDPLPDTSPPRVRPIDKDLLWKEYQLHIDLYKDYMKIVATFNAFFYGVTGAVLSYCLRAENKEVRWALFFPPLMCVFFAYVFFKSWNSFRKVEDEIACIAYAFGFERPEVNTLTKILLSSWIMYIATFCGLVFVICKAPPWG